MSQIRKRLTYANVMSTIAVFLVLGGATALAASSLGKNTVGAKQLKKEAVTAAKIKNGAVTGAKLNLSTLGTVPAATNATNAVNATNATNAVNATNALKATTATTAAAADNANTVGGHAAACPANTTLIRGLCFDSTPNPAVFSVFSASDECAAKGGWLPTPMALRSTADVLDLGTGSGSDSRYTDSIFTEGANFKTMVVVDNGGFTSTTTSTPERYFCVYPLVR